MILSKDGRHAFRRQCRQRQRLVVRRHAVGPSARRHGALRRRPADQPHVPPGDPLRPEHREPELDLRLLGAPKRRPDAAARLDAAAERRPRRTRPRWSSAPTAMCSSSLSGPPNLLTSYVVDRDGIAGAPTSYASTGTTPFGFAFTKRGDLVVSNAGLDGCLVLLGRARWEHRPDHGARHRPGSRLLDGRDAERQLCLHDEHRRRQPCRPMRSRGTAASRCSPPSPARPAAALPTPRSAATDASSTSATQAQGAINAFRIASDGSLAPLAGTSGLPAGFAGLAAS